MEQVVKPKKWRKPVIIILAALFILAAAARIAVEIMAAHNTFIFCGGRIINDGLQFALDCLLGAVVIAAVICFSRYLPVKITLVAICVIVLFFVYLFNSGLFDPYAYSTYYQFTSPNQKIVVVEERPVWFDSVFFIYQKTGDFTLQMMDGNGSTKYPTGPFSDNDYQLTWSDDAVTVTYKYDSGIEKSETFQFVK